MSHSRCIVFMPMFVAVAASVRSATIARLDSSVFDHPARAMSHAWEAADIHPWETEQSDHDSDSDGMPNDQDVAAEELVNGLLELYLLSQISARHFCVLCYWAAQAGVRGVVSKYAYKPGSSTGNYQRHLDSVLGMGETKGQIYNVQTIGHPNGCVERKELVIP